MENGKQEDVSEPAVFSSPASLTDESSWGIESLARRAIERTKERFLSYFLATILGMAIALLVFLALLLLVGLCLLAYSLSPFAAVVLGLITAFLAVAAFVYISAWVHLSTLSVLISPERPGAVEAFGKTKRIVPGYVIYVLLSSTFISGLLLFGVLSLFLVFILWAVWSVFSSFVYLERQEKGLSNLWISKALVSQRFWGILGRILLVNLGVIVVQGLLSSRENFFSVFSSLVFSMLAAPFISSFTFEIYKNLKYPDRIEAPKTWLSLSTVGWFLIFLLIVVSFAVAISTLSGLGGAGFPLPFKGGGGFPSDLPLPTPSDLKGYL